MQGMPLSIVDYSPCLIWWLGWITFHQEPWCAQSEYIQWGYWWICPADGCVTGSLPLYHPLSSSFSAPRQTCFSCCHFINSRSKWSCWWLVFLVGAFMIVIILVTLTKSTKKFLVLPNLQNNVKHPMKLWDPQSGAVKAFLERPNKPAEKFEGTSLLLTAAGPVLLPCMTPESMQPWDTKPWI